MDRWQVENIITISVAAALVAGLYYMSSSFHSLWGFVILFNLNNNSRP